MTARKPVAIMMTTSMRIQLPWTQKMMKIDKHDKDSSDSEDSKDSESEGD